MSDDAEVAELVAFIREHGSAGKLLLEHTPGPDGRCPRCSSGGDSSGKVFGCPLYRAAQRAEEAP